MSFNRLTIQSLQAERQRVAYQGLSGLGDANTRPSVDYVKAGDVIRVNVAWYRPTGWFADVPALYTAFRNGLAAVFNVVAMSPQEYWLSAGGDITVDVQTRGDFARLGDVVSVVMNRAQAAGLNVNVASSRGEFISKVETTGGNVPATLPDPSRNTTPSPSPILSNVGSTATSFIDSLTSSPVTLAVILGAAVILVIAAKK